MKMMKTSSMSRIKGEAAKWGDRWHRFRHTRKPSHRSQSHRTSMPSLPIGTSVMTITMVLRRVFGPFIPHGHVTPKNIVSLRISDGDELPGTHPVPSGTEKAPQREAADSRRAEGWEVFRETTEEQPRSQEIPRCQETSGRPGSVFRLSIKITQCRGTKLKYDRKAVIIS